jgi:hypothetical protein
VKMIRLFIMISVSAVPSMAQVPAGATPITIKQVNTLAGITTWTFTDPAGDVYYLQSAAYLVANIPGGASATIPLWAPGLWVIPSVSTPPPPTTPTPSPDLTAIANNDGKAIYDAALNKWTIVNNQVLENGKPAGYTSGVIKLVTVKGILWQENSALGWWYWNTTAATWDGGAAPI